jgi:hypothetical protein
MKKNIRTIKTVMAAKGWAFTHRCGNSDYFHRIIRWNGAEFAFVIAWNRKYQRWETHSIGNFDGWNGEFIPGNGHRRKLGHQFALVA